MNILGFNKTTLLDYPGHLASTIFLGGCNFLCPFCHNSSLVLKAKELPVIAEEEVFYTLKKRTGILEGVCITGGEPTLHPDLPEFISKIKSLGYLVKLDTNGSNPKMLKELSAMGYIDYIAMDVKNTKEKYSLSVGLNNILLDNISESIEFLLSGKSAYEFRTTVVKELHRPQDIVEIGKWISGAKSFFLQPYKDSGDVISPIFTSYTKDELTSILNLILPYADVVRIRGID